MMSRVDPSYRWFDCTFCDQSVFVVFVRLREILIYVIYFLLYMSFTPRVNKEGKKKKKEKRKLVKT